MGVYDEVLSTTPSIHTSFLLADALISIQWSISSFLNFSLIPSLLSLFTQLFSVLSQLFPSLFFFYVVRVSPMLAYPSLTTLTSDLSPPWVRNDWSSSIYILLHILELFILRCFLFVSVLQLWEAISTRVNMISSWWPRMESSLLEWHLSMVIKIEKVWGGEWLLTAEETHTNRAIPCSKCFLFPLAHIAYDMNWCALLPLYLFHPYSSSRSQFSYHRFHIDRFVNWKHCFRHFILQY